MKEAKQKKQKTITLSDGRVAEIGNFKGTHVMRAISMVGENTEKMMLALISLCVTIDGNAIPMEDLEEMNGFDVMSLVGEFSGNFQTSVKS